METRLDRIEKAIEGLLLGISELKESQKKTDSQILELKESRQKTDEQMRNLIGSGSSLQTRA
jgi:septation ring formation regulator EzrA